MRIESESWYVLSIFSDESKRELLIPFFEDLHCGIHDMDLSSEIYFQNPDKEYIEKIIKENSNIRKWEWRIVKKENWNESWKPFFKNISIENKVRIIPSWENNDSNSEEIILQIEPGMAFGTGHHETTFMMIQSILKYVNSSTSVLDIGCGSGILSILSDKLGAKNILAIDNDFDVVENFKYNLNLNNCSIDLNIDDCLTIKDFNYDVILANINRHILLDLLPLIFSESIIILSGILIDDIPDFKQTLNKFTIIETIKKNEWACLVIQKR